MRKRLPGQRQVTGRETDKGRPQAQKQNRDFAFGTKAKSIFCFWNGMRQVVRLGCHMSARAGVAARSASSTCPSQLRVLFRILCSRATAPPLSAPPLSDLPKPADRNALPAPRPSAPGSTRGVLHTMRAAPPCLALSRTGPHTRVPAGFKVPAGSTGHAAASRGSGFSVFPFAISHRWGRTSLRPWD